MKIFITEKYDIPTGKYCNKNEKSTCIYLHKHLITCTLFSKDLKEHKFIDKCDKCLQLKSKDALYRTDRCIKKITEKKFSNCPHKDDCDLIDGADAKRFFKNMTDTKKIEAARAAERALQERMNEVAKRSSGSSHNTK